MRKILDKAYLYAGYLSGVFLVIIFLLMMGLSVGRMVNINIKAGDDFASWAMAAMAFLGLAHTFREGQLIRVGLLIDRFQGRTRHIMELVALGVGVFFTCFFAYHVIQMVIWSYKLNDMAQGVVAMPLWIPQLGFAAGIVLLAVAFLDEFIHVLRGNRPTYVKEEPKTAEEKIARALETAI
jgi:TRAP-type C4-dicarboxylate transport system permease small subunit